MPRLRIVLPLLAIAVALFASCTATAPVAARDATALPEPGDVSPRKAH